MRQLTLTLTLTLNPLLYYPVNLVVAANIVDDAKKAFVSAACPLTSAPAQAHFQSIIAILPILNLTVEKNVHTPAGCVLTTLVLT